ncbi:MAG: Gfo/Idh/MocA family oxidoreductase [Chloroflexota bacterium]
MDLLKVAVIGCGGHAQSHLRMIQAEPRLHLAAVADIDPSRLAQAEANFSPDATFDNYEQMLDEMSLDLVYVVTLAGHQLPIVQECLGRDLHTSIEKAPGMTAADTREMLVAANASKAKAIVSFNRRYFPQILAVRKLLQERGGAVQVAANYHKPPSGMDAARREVVPPELTSDAIHHVDLLRWMAGRTPTEAVAASQVYAQSWCGERSDTPRYNALIDFENGAKGVMMSHFGVGYRIQSAEVHAEDMSAYFELTRSPQVTLYLDGKLVETPLDLESVGGADFNETGHFVDCILNDTEPWSTVGDAVQTMDLCEAIVGGHRGQL